MHLFLPVLSNSEVERVMCFGRDLETLRSIMNPVMTQQPSPECCLIVQSQLSDAEPGVYRALPQELKIQLGVEGETTARKKAQGAGTKHH